MLTTGRLNGYAQEMGFESEVERLEMILSVPGWGQDALEAWLDEDGSRDGLVAILATKRPLGRHPMSCRCEDCMDDAFGPLPESAPDAAEQRDAMYGDLGIPTVRPTQEDA